MMVMMEIMVKTNNSCDEMKKILVVITMVIAMVIMVTVIMVMVVVMVEYVVIAMDSPRTRYCGDYNDDDYTVGGR